MFRAGLLCLAVSMELAVGAILFARYEPWFLGPVLDPFKPPTMIGTLYFWVIGVTLLCGLFLSFFGGLAKWARYKPEGARKPWRR